jgi:hypothetical protein
MNLKPSGIAKLYFGYAPFDTVAQLTCGYNVLEGWARRHSPGTSPYDFRRNRTFCSTEP